MATSPAFTQPRKHSHSLYELEPLHTTSNDFRLLQILPDTPTESVRCHLRTFAMDHAPAYVALSYTWGSEHPQKTIEINGSEFSIRQNLFDFLAVARSKYSTEEDFFWIDQICIDQGSVGERNHQVSLMSRIYTEAVYVVAWLGAEGDDSDVAISYIEEMSEADRRHPRRFPSLKREPDEREHAALIALFARPYWRRLWIIQEVVLARNVTLLCGVRQLSWLAVKAFVQRQHVARTADVISAHVTKLFTIHERREYHGDGDPNSSSAPSYWLNTCTGGYDATESLRALVYKCCDFECSDPRDKIYGVMGIYKRPWTSTKNVDIDYNKPVETVFWDFFTTYLDGIHFAQYNKIRSPPALSMEEVMGDWWHYAMRLMNGMELHSYALRRDVASVLERKFQGLRRDSVAYYSTGWDRWVTYDARRTDEKEDISDFFAKKLQTASTQTSYSIQNRMDEL